MRGVGVRTDPGDCIICGAAHCACGGGPIEVVQLPQRDATAETQSTEPPVELTAPVAEPDPPVVFTTSSYRGTKKTAGPRSRS